MLRLDQRKSAFEKLESGKLVVVPGNITKSEIMVRLLSSDPDSKMQPPNSGYSISRDQIQKTRRWINEGAAWESLWAFRPLERPGLPNVKNEQWARNAVDRFVLSKLEALNLKPAAEANQNSADSLPA